MKKKGFTLIELMITLALFSLFAGFLYNAYFTQIKENNSFNTRIDLKYNGDKAMRLITEELRSNINFYYTYESGSNINITQIKSNDLITNKILIDLTGDTSTSDLQLTSNKTLINNSNLNHVVLCEGITSINMKFGTADEKDLIIITIELQSKNDRYTVTSAVNINK
ncbi:MAG TPA: prepilin-type N-terminal cleavage/methylation domain-containing protein [Clostridium sp.]|uniref:PulJ/GspJ family protein n=1 Tax=Clostridium sp. TaxID=1506 RepID=UPI002F9487D7